jgi:hypothetical protein
MTHGVNWSRLIDVLMLLSAILIIAGVGTYLLCSISDMMDSRSEKK